MQTHDDSQHARSFLERLTERAEQSKRDRTSEITTGKVGEKPIQMFEFQEIQVVQLPDDEQGILRISIGGGDDVPLSRPINYCNFRGDPSKVIKLLERCIVAMRKCQ